MYQALFTKLCTTKEDAKRFFESKYKEQRGSPYTLAHYAFLAKYGGEPFSAKQAQAVLEATPVCVFNPGTTIEKILKESVRFGILHKLD